VTGAERRRIASGGPDGVAGPDGRALLRRTLAAIAALAALVAPAHAQPRKPDATPAVAPDGKPDAKPDAKQDDEPGGAPAQPGAQAGQAAQGAPALRTTQVCIDEAIANRLAVKRQRRKAVDRLFVKQARHELSAIGGYYQSDLFSGTYVAGGSYTYHMTENTAVEFGAAYTHANADVIRAIEDGRATLLDDEYDRMVLVESMLLWSPIYGKLRLGGSIVRFDINAALGVGVAEAATSRGAVGVAGVGMKLFVGRALAFRIDARNHVFQQELLDEPFLVNDMSITSGLSLFLPMRN
jgi:outer membrane beta-barrel protein